MLKYLITLFLIFPIFADTITGKVIKITDGDTIHLLLDNHNREKIRLAGIDAPERKQAHGSKATRYLASLIARKTVTIEYNKRDRYGRIVGKIIFNDEDVNLKMVKVGYAWWYKKYKREQSADDRLSYAVAENNARKFNLGLFQNEAVPPWEWRKNRKNLRKLKKKSQPVYSALSNTGGSNVNVWVNLKSGKYHCPDTRYYNNTKKGVMMLQSVALKSGYIGSHGVSCN